MDVLGHRLLVAADVEMRAVLEPGEQLGAALPHAVLDVDLLGLIAREGDVEAGEQAVLQPLLPFELVQEIVGEVAIAEEQPVAPAGTCRLPLLQEGAKRRDAGAGADHDDRPVRIVRQAEVLVRLDVDLEPVADPQPLGDEARGDAAPRAAVAFVAHDADQKMRLVGAGRERRGDRVQARRQLAQQAGELRRRQLRRKILEQIDDLPALDIGAPAVAREQVAQLGDRA